jgi:drug/metabolite transporter (DMT)-like permease
MNTLSPIGLLLAAAMSATNVLTDVFRKKAFHERQLAAAAFWTRVVVAMLYAGAIGYRFSTGHRTHLHYGGPLFGIASLHLHILPTFLIYLFLDVALVTLCLWLYFRALQVSPLSVCIPFLAFTPVFLIPTGYVLWHELPSLLKSLGVILIVIGSLVMHWRQFAVSWMAPFRAIIDEKNSRYMLGVAFLFSLTNPLDKKLVQMSDAYFQAFAFSVGLCWSFFLLAMLQRHDLEAALQDNIPQLTLAGAGEAVSRLLQFASYNFIAMAIAASIKGAGIVLAVFCGYWFFQERGISDKAIAASVMLAGMVILYLPVTAPQACALAAVTLAGMFAALYAKRPPTPESERISTLT